MNSKPTKTTRDNFFAFEISTKVLNLTRTFNLFDCFFVLESKFVFKSTLKKRNSSTGSTVICFPGRSKTTQTSQQLFSSSQKAIKLQKHSLKICTMYILAVCTYAWIIALDKRVFWINCRLWPKFAYFTAVISKIKQVSMTLFGPSIYDRNINILYQRIFNTF